MSEEREIPKKIRFLNKLLIQMLSNNVSLKQKKMQRYVTISTNATHCARNRLFSKLFSILSI